MQLPDDLAEHLLDTWPVARLATLGEAGDPAALPIVFARDGGALWSPVDGKPKAGGELARVRRVCANPRVSLLLDHYEERWERLWWLRVDGEASVVAPADPERDPAVAGALRALRRKYPQYGTVPVLRDPPTLLRIEPVRRRSWCAGEAALAAIPR